MKLVSSNRIQLALATWSALVSITRSSSVPISSKLSFDIHPKTHRQNHVGIKNHDTKESTDHVLSQTPEEMESFRLEKFRRMQKRREMARETIKEMIENPQNYMTEKTELMSEDQINDFREEIMKKDPSLEKKEHRWLRRYSNSNKSTYNPYKLNHLANPGEYYNEWAQAYRMLGAFISCENSGNNNGGNNHGGNNHGGNDNQGCKRFVIWAAVSERNIYMYFMIFC